MARTTLKPATRIGLTVLIVVLLAANVAVVVVRYGRSDRTQVSVAPSPSTTRSPVTESTMPTTVSPTTVSPTSVAPTSVAPTPTTVAGTITVPTDPVTGLAAPGGVAEHPHTGGHPLSLLALGLVAAGLACLRFSRRTPVRRRES